MSYIGDMLQSVLGGKSAMDSHSGVIRDWSPNEVRALFIMRTYILVADYIKNPKVVSLDHTKVMEELQNSSINSRPVINSILSNRQLSCLEEIYVDPIFGQARKVDLEAYVRSAMRDNWRLRYYGYAGISNAEDLLNTYRKVKEDGIQDFTVAEKVKGIAHTDTQNTEWYTKYSLRPQYYALDAPNQRLAVWFKKVETMYTTLGAQRKQVESEVELEKKVVSIVERDVWGLPSLVMLQKLFNILKRDSKTKIQEEFIKNYIKGMRSIQNKYPGLKTELMSIVEKNQDATLVKMSKYYTVFGVSDRGDFNEKCLEDFNSNSNDGFLHIYSMLDTIGAGMVKSLKNNNNPILGYSAFIDTREVGGLVESRTTNELGINNGLNTNQSDIKNAIKGFEVFILALCGWNEATLNAVYSTKGEKA